MAPFSSLLVFSHFWLITINKIILPFFLNFLFTLSLFPFSCFNFSFLFYCLLHFRSNNFFSYFFLQISSSVSSNSSSFLLFQSSFPHSLAWLHLKLLFIFLNFYPFFSLFSSFNSLSFSSPLPLHIPITPLWWFPQYSLTFPSFSLVAAFHSSSLFSSTSDLAISFPFFSFLCLFSSHSSLFLLFQFQSS